VFGLVFATFLTLVMVPVMYAMNKRSIDVLDRYNMPRWLKYVPFLVLIIKIFMKRDDVRKMHDPRYLSPKPYDFFPEPEAAIEEPVQGKKADRISVN